MATSLPVRRLELRAGKFGMADFFDQNGIGSDSHYQFLNWAVDNNGAYDYAADTRGYTVGVIAEYHDRNWAFRFAEALMPKIANGPDLDWNLRRARAENFELEVHPRLLSNHSTTLRLLSFVNHANMGIYRQAINDFLAGKTPRPEIRAHPLQSTVKYGFGINMEQALPHHWRGFARWGWNEGQHESYAYTEVDQTVEFGADLAGNAWRRKGDKVGGVFVSNGISADHQRYLALGGIGFLLGDGALNDGPGEYCRELLQCARMAWDLRRPGRPAHRPSRVQSRPRASPRTRGTSPSGVLRIAGRVLLLHLYSLPERHIPVDLLRCRFNLGIEPGCVMVDLAVYFDVIIARRALPWTHSVGCARLEMFGFDRVRRKILVTFHFHTLA